MDFFSSGWPSLVCVIVVVYFMSRRQINISQSQQQHQEAHGGSAVTSSSPRGAGLPSLLIAGLIGLMLIALAIALVTSAINAIPKPIEQPVQQPITQPQAVPQSVPQQKPVIVPAQKPVEVPAQKPIIAPTIAATRVIRTQPTRVTPVAVPSTIPEWVLVPLSLAVIVLSWIVRKLYLTDRRMRQQTNPPTEPPNPREVFGWVGDVEPLDVPKRNRGELL